MGILRLKRTWSALGGYHRGLALVGAAYLLVFSWLIIAGHGVPYVMDANETFSVWWHSYNLFHFDFWQSAGLTDEAFSFDAAAHPVVHPHQGNWPRLFGFVIFVLGARTVESQILVTTFTVGCFGIFLAYHFFSTRVDPIYATLFCLFLMTDYVLYAQWHVVTYRVWHLIFFFSTLLCAVGWRTGRRLRWVPLTIANYAALYYYELVYAAFLSSLVGAYTIYLHWRRPKLLIQAVAVQLLGAGLGLLVLAVQLIHFYGIEGLKTDFYYTFLARNHVTSLQQLREQMRAFYDAYNVAFWYNFGNNSDYVHLITFVRSFFSYDFQTHTPIFTALILAIAAPLLLSGSSEATSTVWWRSLPRIVLASAALVAVAAGLGALMEAYRGALGVATLLALVCVIAAIPFVGRMMSSLFDRPTGILALAASWIADVALCAGFMLLLLVVTSPFAVDATPPNDRWLHGRSFAAAFAGGVALMIATKALSGLTIRLTEAGSRARVALAALVVAASAVFIRYQAGLYAQDSAVLWQRLDAMNFPAALFQVALVAAVTLAAIVIMAPRLRVWKQLHELRAYVACGLVGYAFTYVLSAGYIYSGYLSRSAPFTVFLTDAIIAAAAYCVCQVLRSAFDQVRATGGAVRRDAMIALPACLLMVIVTSWLWQQLDYIRLLPPDFLHFMTRLGAPPYRGQSFTVGNYAAPTAAYTGKWAFYSDKLSYWAVRERAEADSTNATPPEDVEPSRELPYLWMADRRTNPLYLKPTYYLCFFNQTLTTLVIGMKAEQDDRWTTGCGPLVDSVKALVKQPWRALTPRVVDYDREGVARRRWQAWAILKLDWDLPPYLRPAGAARDARPVEVTAVAQDGHYHVGYSYRYAQRDGVQEDGTVVSLVRAGVGDTCDQPGPDLTILAQQGQGGASGFDLPRTISGALAVRVIPKTAAKTGRAYYSDTLLFRGDGQPPVTCDGTGPLPGEPTPEQLAGEGYYVPGHTIDFRSSAWDDPYIGEGWSEIEELGRWSIEDRSTFTMRFAKRPVEKPMRFTARVLPFVVPAHPKDVVHVLANGTKVATWSFEKPGWTDITATIPPSAWDGCTTLTVSFVASDVVSPASIGVSNDLRRLKLLFQTATISQP